MRARACVCVITHACGHLWMSVGTRVGMSVSPERSGRCMRLGVTAVTQELQWAERQRRGVGGGSRGSAPRGGELLPRRFGPERQARGSTGSARTGASVRGASRVCALGPADARNLQATCLPICTPTRRSGAGSCAPKGPGKTCPGVWVPSGPCLRLPALGRGYGRGVLRLLFSREESAPSPPQPSLQVRLGRARAAAGEGKGPQSGASTPAGTFFTEAPKGSTGEAKGENPGPLPPGPPTSSPK